MQLLQLSLVAAVYLRGELEQLTLSGDDPTAVPDPGHADVSVVMTTATPVTAAPPDPADAPPDPLAAPPAAAAAASVGQPGSAHTTTHIEDPKYQAALHSAFVLQAVRPQDDPSNALQVRDALDPSEDHCLEVNATGEDEFGGHALVFGHCRHQDPNMGEVPTEQQWFLMPDGKIAAAGNTTHPRCIRQQSCNGAPVYDVAPCDYIGAVDFRAAATMAGRIDEVKRVGPPINGVVEPGRLHGPFQLYTACPGVETDEGCVDNMPRTGWTKLPTHYLGPLKFQEEEKPPIDWLKTAGQVGEGDFGGAVDAFSAATRTAADEVATGAQLGVARHETAQCGSLVGLAARQESWWYFLRI